MTRQMKESL